MPALLASHFPNDLAGTAAPAARLRKLLSMSHKILAREAPNNPWRQVLAVVGNVLEQVKFAREIKELDTSMSEMCRDSSMQKQHVRGGLPESLSPLGRELQCIFVFCKHRFHQDVLLQHETDLLMHMQPRVAEKSHVSNNGRIR